MVDDIIAAGEKKAEETAKATLREVRARFKIINLNADGDLFL